MDTIETHIFQNGEYVATRVSAVEILRRAREANQKEQTVVTKQPTPAAIGLLSTTLVPSPVVNQILPARIRGSAFNDLLFVGEDFVHVVQIQPDGRLQYVGTKSDFGSRIRAAAIVGKRLEDHDDAFPPFLKTESPSTSEEDAPVDGSMLPLQMLVVSLASGELQFLFASYSRDWDSLTFFKSRVQLPLGRIPLLQTGRHLVVDPLSRAIAVGSVGGTIIVHKLKQRDRLEQDFQSHDFGWNPVEDDLSIDTRGIVLQMAFLAPRSSDEHHALLAAIVNDQAGVCRIRCYEIDLTHSFHNVSPTFDYRLEDEFRATTLLIPTSYSPNFLLVSGNKCSYWSDVLTGSPNRRLVSSTVVGPAVEDPKHPDPKNPASSSRVPIYTAWTRAERHHKEWKEKRNEVFYLVREDGKIHQISITRESLPVLSKGGTFACSGSTAFTSFLANDKYMDPDYLVVAGQGSNGQVIQIGTGTIPQTQPAKDRNEIMKPNHIEWIPNWAPVSDISLISTESRTSPANSLSSIYMTSGTQPYGAVSELRVGIEARINISLELMDESEMAQFTNMWPLTIETKEEKETLVFFSAPNETLVVRYNESDEAQAAEGDIEREQETLLAVDIESNCILHVTSQWIIVYNIQYDDEIPRLARSAEHFIDGSILKVSYLETQSMLLIGVQQGDLSWLQAYTIANPMDQCLIEPFSERVSMQSYPTAVKLFHDTTTVGALVADGRGIMQAFQIFNSPDDSRLVREMAIPTTDRLQEFTPLAETITILSSGDHVKDRPHSIIAVGLRDGRIWLLGGSGLRFEQSLHTSHLPSSLCEELANHLDSRVDASNFITVGVEPVRILSHNHSTSPMAVLVCGPDVCRLKYQGGGFQHFQIDSIWFTDYSQPQFSQRSFYAMAFHPSTVPAQMLQPQLFGITGSSLLVADLEARRKPLPRRMILEETNDRGAENLDEKGASNPAGSPRQLVFMKKLNLLGVAITMWELKPEPAHPPQMRWRGRRRVRGALKFVRIDDPAASLSQEPFKLLPGERITTMDEWPELSMGKTENSAYLVIGTRYKRMADDPKGRVLFVKVWLDDELVPCLRIIKVHTFGNAPVTAVRSLGSKESAISFSDLSADINETEEVGEGSSNERHDLSRSSLSSRNPRLAVAVDKKLEIYELQVQLPTQNVADAMQQAADSFGPVKLRRICSRLLPSYAVRITGHTDNFVSVTTDRDSWQSYTLDVPDSLKLTGSDEVARRGLDHKQLLFRDHHPPETSSSPKLSDEDAGLSMVLISDRENRVAGLEMAPPGKTTEIACRTLFTANMPQAIVRLECGNIRPVWRRRLAAGVKANNIVGVATDGSFYGLSILDEPALRLLQFLHNLVTYHDQGLRWKTKQYHGEPIVIDPEFSKKHNPKSSPMNHVNGDVLIYLLDKNGKYLFQEMLESPHWENDATASHFGNTVEDRREKFEELVRRIWNDRTFEGLEDVVECAIGWLRVVLSPML